jgi:hypothetical protein
MAGADTTDAVVEQIDGDVATWRVRDFNSMSTGA